MYHYYLHDIKNGLHDEDEILELIECYWLKLSEWAWTISANTADFLPAITNSRTAPSAVATGAARMRPMS